MRTTTTMLNLNCWNTKKKQYLSRFFSLSGSCWDSKTRRWRNNSAGVPTCNVSETSDISQDPGFSLEDLLHRVFLITYASQWSTFNPIVRMSTFCKSENYLWSSLWDDPEGCISGSEVHSLVGQCWRLLYVRMTQTFVYLCAYSPMSWMSRNLFV